MSQGPLGQLFFFNPAGVSTGGKGGLVGGLIVEDGGQSRALNVTAAANIKATPGRIKKIIIVNPGTAGTLTLNDTTTTGAAAAGNTVFSQAFNATAAVAGQVITLDFPCTAGITISAIPTGGIVAISYS